MLKNEGDYSGEYFSRLTKTAEIRIKEEKIEAIQVGGTS